MKYPCQIRVVSEPVAWIYSLRAALSVEPRTLAFQILSAISTPLFGAVKNTQAKGQLSLSPFFETHLAIHEIQSWNFCDIVCDTFDKPSVGVDGQRRFSGVFSKREGQNSQIVFVPKTKKLPPLDLVPNPTHSPIYVVHY
ncbi:MAG: hypothetical protein EXS25_07365 [Pedosphaera sp.]|nr:hypothetical protein [Pedosphaera sp.]